MNRATHTRHTVPLDRLDFFASRGTVAAEHELTYGEGWTDETHEIAITGSNLDALTCAIGLLREAVQCAPSEVNPASADAWEASARELIELAHTLSAAVSAARVGVA